MAAHELDRDVRAELRSLSKLSADTVSRRLVASGELLNVDPELALRHALAARRIASRISAVREAVGLAAYQCGQWQLAIAELRAFQRMTGRSTHLAVLADAERGLGRPERAVDMFRHTERKSVAMNEWIELLIVAAGARRDMGQHAAAVTMLQVPALEGAGTEPWRPRLRYAYADSLAVAGRTEEAYRWFARTIELDPQGETDAVDRLLALEGVVIEGDDLPDEPDDEETDARTDAARPAVAGRTRGDDTERSVSDVDATASPNADRDVADDGDPTPAGEQGVNGIDGGQTDDRDASGTVGSAETVGGAGDLGTDGVAVGGQDVDGAAADVVDGDGAGPGSEPADGGRSDRGAVDGDAAGAGGEVAETGADRAAGADGEVAETGADRAPSADGDGAEASADRAPGVVAAGAVQGDGTDESGDADRTAGVEQSAKAPEYRTVRAVEFSDGTDTAGRPEDEK